MLSNTSLVVIAIFCWGFAMFLPKLATQNLSPAAVVLCNAAGYLALLPFVARLLEPRDWPLRTDHLWGVLVGMLYIGGNLAYYRLLVTGAVSRYGPLTALYIALPVLLATILLRERLSPQQWAGVAMALAAGYLLSIEAPAGPVSAPVAP